MNVKLVKIDLRFIQKKKSQDVYLEAFYPLVDGIIYQPVKWIIKSGQLSNDYMKNSSQIKAKDRDVKTKLMNEITTPLSGGLFKIVKEKVFFDNYSSKGLGAVIFLTNLTGANANRDAKLYIRTFLEEFQGLNIATLFQDPNNAPKEAIEFLQNANEKVDILSFEDFVMQNEEYASILSYNYYENIRTCSTKNPVIDKNKNGQAKDSEMLYKEIISEIKDAEKLNINNTGVIMNAFKKNLDRRFGFVFSTRRCLICGIHHPNMLVASHIKARSESETVDEKIDGKNGLWLCAQHDRAFDRRLITFESNGQIKICDQLKSEKIFNENFFLPSNVFNESKKYLEFHNLKYKEKFGN